MCVSMCAHTCGGVRGQTLLWVSSSVALGIIVLNQLLFLNIKFTGWLDGMVSMPPELSSSLGLPGLQVCVAVLGFMWVLGLACRAPCRLSSFFLAVFVCCSYTFPG